MYCRVVGSAPLLAAVVVSLAGACADAPATAPHPDASVQASKAACAAGGDVAYWDEVARRLVVEQKPVPIPMVAARQFAYLSLAQAAAIEDAERVLHGPAAVREGAIAGASAATLAYLFPAASPAALDALAEGRAPTPPGQRRHFAAGEALGRWVADRVIARAKADRFDAVWTGQVPVGPGLWTANGPPVGPLLGQMRPFFLASGSQFRPGPPPAFGSPAYLQALAEVRQIAATRTAEQTRIAQFWLLPAGTVQAAGYWNAAALELIAEHCVGEEEAAHLLAVLHGAMMDALIASHDAKYTYWLPRPSQADPAISLAVPLPNFPSYPANHSALGTAAVTVLGAAFPAEREGLEAQAREEGLSRIYGGVHYRFDVEVGADLGRTVAGVALAYGAQHDLLALVP